MHFLIVLVTAASLAVAQSFTCNTPVPAKYTGATTVFGWGANWYSQISSPKETEPRPYPVLVGSSSMNVSKITGGFMHNAVLDSAGKQAWLAGIATSGQMGGGPTVNTKQSQYLPVPFIVDDAQPELFTRPVKDVATGYQHSCLITTRANTSTAQNVVYCAGVNDRGQLGRNDIESVTYILPVIISTTEASFASESFTAITSGPDHVLALSTSGNLWAWGSGTKGELGNGALKDSKVPVRVNMPTKNIEKIACGHYYCMALDAQHQLWGWGQNDKFQLGGKSSKKEESTPVLIMTDVTDFSCGGAHVLAIVNNRLYSWGDGTMGATGHAKNIPALLLDKWTVKAPTAVPDFASVNIRSIAAGAKHSVVLDSCGTVYTMGSDAVGQLGQEALTGKRYLFRSLAAKTNANIARRGVKPVAVYASWFNSFVVTEETVL